jgi:hypothetical protein
MTCFIIQIKTIRQYRVSPDKAGFSAQKGKVVVKVKPLDGTFCAVLARWALKLGEQSSTSHTSPQIRGRLLPNAHAIQFAGGFDLVVQIEALLHQRISATEPKTCANGSLLRKHFA